MIHTYENNPDFIILHLIPWRDNVFVERLCKSVKYERVLYLHAYDSVNEARKSIMHYLDWLQPIQTAFKIKQKNT